jgi:hypothetical protein
MRVQKQDNSKEMLADEIKLPAYFFMQIAKKKHIC